METQAKQRLFVGVFPPGGLLAELEPRISVWKDAIPDPQLRWSPMDNLHLTLCFLGGVPEERIDEFADALIAATKGVSSLSLGLKGLGVFPAHQRPKVLWAGISGDIEPLQVLQTRVREAGLPYCAKPDDKPFSPHLTLARIKEGDGKLSRAVRRLATAESELEMGPWPVTRVQLMKSLTGSDRSRYEEVAGFDLMT